MTGPDGSILSEPSFPGHCFQAGLSQLGFLSWAFPVGLAQLVQRLRFQAAMTL
jgi:hypothetical protein